MHRKKLESWGHDLFSYYLLSALGGGDLGKVKVRMRCHDVCVVDFDLFMLMFVGVYFLGRRENIH